MQSERASGALAKRTSTRRIRRMRHFGFSMPAKQIYLYDQVLLVEASGEREKLVERYRVWNDELFREERFQQLLDELHPAARV